MSESRKRKKNYRSRSKADELPQEIREKLDAMLFNRLYTYKDVGEELERMGYPLSQSVIYRYAQRIDAVAARIQAAMEQTEALIKSVENKNDIKATELASALMCDGLIKRMAMAESEFEDMPLDKAGDLLIKLQRTSVYKDRWKAERKRLIERLKTEFLLSLKDEVQEDDELLERLNKMVERVAAKEAAKDDK